MEQRLALCHYASNLTLKVSLLTRNTGVPLERFTSEFMTPSLEKLLRKRFRTLTDKDVITLYNARLQVVRAHSRIDPLLERRGPFTL